MSIKLLSCAPVVFPNNWTTKILPLGTHNCRTLMDWPGGPDSDLEYVDGRLIETRSRSCFPCTRPSPNTCTAMHGTGGIYIEIETGRRFGRPELARALEACRVHKATLSIARLDGLVHNAQALCSIFDATADCEAVFCGPHHIPTLRSGRHFAPPMEAVSAPEAIRQHRHVGQDQEPAISRAGAVHRSLAGQRAVDILRVIRAVQASGVSTLQGMADALNARGVRTARGGKWYPTTVRNLLRRDLRSAQPAMC